MIAVWRSFLADSPDQNAVRRDTVFAGELLLRFDCWIMTIAKMAAILCLLSPAALAQSLTPDIVVSDLNVVATYLSKDKLLNSEVMNIAAVTCSTMGVARETRAASLATDFMAKYSPSPDEISKVGLQQFIQFENENLAKFGVSQPAITLIDTMIRQRPELPATVPSKENVESVFISLESLACDLKAQPVAYLAQPASSDTQKLGLSLGKGLFGFGVLVLDIFVSTGVPHPAMLLLSAVSIGWGWARVEESFFEVKDLSGSAFK